MGTFTSELIFGEYAYGTMTETPNISYKTLLYNGFSPLSLFAASEPGFWFDPSDLSTLFQDTAGTVPVTVAGQSVARINDKSGRGNHATQSTSLSRPTLGRNPVGGTRNLLTYTEQFDNAAWSKQATTVAANSTTAPDGTVTADTLVESTANLGHVASRAVTAITALYVFSVYLKKGSGSTAPNWLQLYTGGVSAQYASFNLGAGAVGSVAAGSTATITSVGNGWYRCTLSFTPSLDGSVSVAIAFTNNTDTTTRGLSYAGTATSDVFIWGAQLETGSTATAYQKVVSAFDVTEAGKADCWYLGFDGSDDFLVTPTITPGTDKAQAFAGVRKLSDAATGTVIELSASGSSGSISVFAPLSAAANYEWRSFGTGVARATSGNTFAAPITNVLTGIGEISTDTAILRVNGAQAATSPSDQGTGNYNNYPLYIGRRGDTAYPFNGRIYSLICRFGSNLAADQITQTEAWVNSKTGAY